MKDILESVYVCIIGSEEKRIYKILIMINDILEENFSEIKACIIVLLKNIHYVASFFQVLF